MQKKLEFWFFQSQDSFRHIFGQFENHPSTFWLQATFSKDPMTLWMDFFEPWPFIILKSSHQDLSNFGSNFILSPLEVGHWLAQTWPFFNNLRQRQDFEFTMFWSRELQIDWVGVKLLRKLLMVIRHKLTP